MTTFRTTYSGNRHSIQDNFDDTYDIYDIYYDIQDNIFR